jgi:hypothetical protein
VAAADDLITARDQACARLAELDTVPVDERARMTYSEGTQTYGWNEYRAALLAQVERLTELIQKVAGPFDVRSVVRG